MGWTLFLELPADGKFACPRMTTCVVLLDGAITAEWGFAT